jgi:hypothetical protein
MYSEFKDKMQTMALDINPTLVIAINDKNKAVKVEHSFSIVLTLEFNRGLFSVSAGAKRIVVNTDIKQTKAVNITLNLKLFAMYIVPNIVAKLAI